MAVPQVIGSLEKVAFPEFSIKGMVAKIDTGAYTGAMHCTKISVDNTGAGEMLHFAPFDHPDTIKSTDKFYTKYVKSSNGAREKRYMVETIIVINGVTYPIKLTLSNRTDMKYPVLIGRRFMREHNLLVDVRVRNK